MAERDAKVKITADASGLQPATTELQKMGNAAEGLGEAAAGTSSELRQVGQTAAEVGAQTEAAARESAAAIETVTAAANEEREAVEAAGRETTESNKRATDSAEQLAAAMRQVAGAIREQDVPLAQRRAALIEYESRLKEIASGYRANTEASRAHAEAAAAALEDVGRHIREVDVEIQKIATDKAFRSLGVAVESTVDEFDLAVVAIKRVQDEINEMGRVSPRSVGFAAQAFENLKLSVGESDERVQQLEKHLASVTARANALTNAAKDNAVGLQETGNRIGTIGLAVQDLGRFAGPTGEKVGNLAAQVGILAIGAEQAKDALGGMNLNQLGAARGAAGLATQLAAIIAAIYGSVAAGKALSETNAENAESWQQLRDVVAKILPQFDNVRDKLGGVQGEIAKLISGGGSVRALDVAMSSGGEAAKVYYNLINSGVPSVQAHQIAVEQAAEATKAYTQAKQLGAAGIRLWDEAVRNSGGTAEGFARELRVLKVQLDEESRVAALAAEAQKEYASKHRDASTALREHTEVVRQYWTAEKENLGVITEASLQTVLLEQAQNGLTEAISQSVAAIGLDIEESDRHSVSLASKATALQSVLDRTDGLTKAERERIQVVIDLAKRGDELTAAEQRRAAQLIADIESGRAITETLRYRATAEDELSAATDRSAESTREASIADDERTVKIRGQLELIREVIAQKEQEESRTRSLADANQYAGDSVDWLRMKEAALTRELEPALTVWHATEKATENATDAKQDHVAALDAERVAADGARVSHEKIQAVVENGKTVYTNLTQAERDATTQLASLAKQSDETAKTFGDVFAVKLNDGRVVIVNSVQAVQDFNAGLDALEARAERARGTIAKMNDEIERTGRVSRESAGAQ